MYSQPSGTPAAELTLLPLPITSHQQSLLFYVDYMPSAGQHAILVLTMAWRPSREDEIDPEEEDVEGEPDPEEEEEDEDEGYELSPDDPDYDLSEAAAYAQRKPQGGSPLIPQWLIVVVSLLLILALVLPLVLRFG